VSAALLDLNVLAALFWPAHEHNEAAHEWFRARAGARWATCPLTQLGFVRLTSNPAFSRDALSPASALALLASNLRHPLHEFWDESLQVPSAIEGIERSLQGYRQLTDAYLLALAHHRQGVLATFDRGLRDLAGEALREAVEVIPSS